MIPDLFLAQTRHDSWDERVGSLTLCDHHASFWSAFLVFLVGMVGRVFMIVLCTIQGEMNIKGIQTKHHVLIRESIRIQGRYTGG